MAGADMVATRVDGNLGLVWAVKQGNAGMVRFALEDGGDAVLLDAETDLASKSSDGVTLLHLAVQARHGLVAQVLLDAGAGVAARDSEGRMALHLAVAPMGASESNDAEVAKVLIHAGADVAAKSNDGQTALHAVAEAGHPNVAKLILHSRADVAARDDQGQTPLHRACKGGRAEMARGLQASGADFFARDTAGRTPIDRSRSSDHAGLFTGLLREEMRRARHVAFAMGLHPRGGEGSVVVALDPDLVRMVLGEVDRELEEGAFALLQPSVYSPYVFFNP